MNALIISTLKFSLLLTLLSFFSMVEAATAGTSLNGRTWLKFEHNNYSVGSDGYTIDGVSVTVATLQPDLVISSLTASDTTPCVGQSVTFSSTVKNQGNAYAPYSYLDYYEGTSASDFSTYTGYDYVMGLNGDSSSAETFLYSFDTPGNYYLNVQADATNRVAESNEGNNTAGLAVSVSSDDVAPTGSLLINGGSNYSNSYDVSLTLAASDEGGCSSGINHMNLFYNGAWQGWESYAIGKSITLTNSGINYVYAMFEDGAGNQSNMVYDAITVDVEAPSSQVSNLPAITTESVFTVTWSGSDSEADSGDSGLSGYNVQVNINDGGWQNWLLNHSSSSSAIYTATVGGDYCFRSQAIDKAGNTESYPPLADTCTTVDLAAATGHQVYLPLLMRDYCSPFIYNEFLPYNLSKINTAGVWDCADGAGVTVAVIDSGVDLDHFDLQANLVGGKSFVSSSPNDDDGHGTHVAGIVAATANNGGVIGVAPAAQIMPVKVFDSSGSGSFYDVSDGVVWAANNGAEVINLSLGSTSNSSTLANAIDYAYNRGVLVVASAGNCGDSSYSSNGCSYQDEPSYPAALWNVLAVASTDSSDNQSSFSTQGYYVDIAAPGSGIYSTYYTGGFTSMSGTSMAAPHVAGLAALLWSKNPGLSRDQVRAAMTSSAVDLGSPGWDSQFGAGRIDAAAAVDATATGSGVTAVEARPSAHTGPPKAYVPGELLVRFKPGVSLQDVTGPLGVQDVTVSETVAGIEVQKLQISPGQEEQLRQALLDSGGVTYVEFNGLVRAYNAE